jgi:parallel beta-helix repeat protein
MIRRLLIPLLLSFAMAPLYAQGADDYGLRFYDGAGAVRVPLHTRRAFLIEVTKPENPAEIVVELDIPGEAIEFEGNCTGPKPVRCTLPASYTSARVFATLNTPGTFTATARLVGVNDSNPSNDQVSQVVEVVALPSLGVSAGAGRQDPGRNGMVTTTVANYGTDANDVVLTVTLPGEGRFTGRVETSDATTTCAVTDATTVVCSRGLLANGGSFSVGTEVAFPERFEGGELLLRATVRSSAADFDSADDTTVAHIPLIRHLLVVNANDEGAGSLRQALLDARQLCEAELCTIEFRVPGVAPGGQVVIQPRTELPEVRGRVKVDGATQTFFGGDTNPDGPEVVIDGSLAQPPARGLVLTGASCELYVLGLAVRNFPAPGIAVHRGLHDYQQCAGWPVPDTIIAGNRISGNYRGVVIVDEGSVRVSDNLITGNQRSGIFADRSAYLEILGNRVTANGASGIFLNPVHPYAFTAVVVEENVVSGNAEWGIARTPTGDARIQRNAIFGNRYFAIDAGLDFGTPNRADDVPWEVGVPNKPVLFSAQYDPVTNTTRVRGRLDSSSSALASFVIDVYVSSSLSGAGQAEAERWAGSISLPENGGHATFEMELEGDQRGRYITATNTRRHLVSFDDFAYDTSELSNVVMVN